MNWEKNGHFGMRMEHGLSDWQIVQQTNGQASVFLAGYWKVPEQIVEQNAYDPLPSVRVMHEETGAIVVPWTTSEFTAEKNGFCGSWSCSLSIPAGGPYRIECGIDVKRLQNPKSYIIRGDVRFHVGVGDLFVIAGQSNAAGYAKDYAADAPDMQVHIYRNRGKWDLASHPLTEFTDAWDAPYSDDRVVGFSPFLAFGKVFHQYSHCPVGLIQTSRGGTGIQLWDPARNGVLYDNMLECIRACGGKTAGVLWYQGCSDADTPEREALYRDSFSNLVRSLRSALGEEIPFFTVQLNREFVSKKDPEFGKIREDQRMLARMLPKVTLMTTLNCGLSDNIHNNAASCLTIGERLAKQCAHYLYGAPAFDPPDVEKAELVRNIDKKGDKESCVVRLTLSHVQRRLLLVGDNAARAGFSVVDEKANAIPLGRIWADKDAGNILYLAITGEVPGKIWVSFACEANPTRVPPVDEDTFLPLASFYQIAVVFV